MGVQSFGNPAASFRGRFGRTGNRTSNPYVSPIGPWSATGGTITTPGNGYRYHTFTSTGPASFVVSSAPAGATIELLMVAGGGGGGWLAHGGGGGGVIFYGSTPTPVTWGSSLPMVAGSYSLSVGAGGNTPASGADYPGPTPALIAGFHGGDTTFTHPSGPFTAQGGGTGIYAGTSPYFDSSPYYRGGSGGLGEGAYPGSPNPSPQRQGFPGAPPPPTPGGGGGTGGAGQPSPTGTSGWNAVGGAGGIGVQFPNFTGPLIGVPSLAPLSGYYAGGGGAGGRNDNNGGPAPQTGYGGAGGLGGGGSGSGSRGRTYPGVPAPYAAAVTNSGGGGGGPGNGGPFPGSDGPQDAEPGAPGIVVIRYLL